jgi:hypothetical protein
MFEGYSNKTYSDNVVQLLSKKNITIPLNSTFEVTKSKFLAGLGAYFPTGIVTYYTVERDYYKFPLIENGINGDFEVKAINGLLVGGSAFNYKMCV